MEELEQLASQCRNCKLCETRNNVVFGVGNPQAEILFIGEGPGENEDLQGEPFVGRAGQLLDKYLAAVDLSRRRISTSAIWSNAARPRTRSSAEWSAPHRLFAQPGGYHPA